MKNIVMKLCLMCGIMLVAAAPLWAETEIVNGIAWTYRIVNDKAEIYNGVKSAIRESTAGAITIPAKLRGKPVTSIGDFAFSHCESLTSVTLPNGVMSIGDRAFIGCRRLTNITLPNSVTNIERHAFHRCTSLTSVMIPKSVTMIGAGAFSWCSALKSFVVADDNPCYKFANGFLLTKDGTRLEYADATLTSVKIPEGVKRISEYAFENCSRLTSVTIPKSVTQLLGGTFSYATELKTLEVAKDNTKYRSVNGLILTKDGTTLVDAAGGLTSIEIPDGVSLVGGSGFYGNRVVERITIPASVTNIARWAFDSCFGDRSISFIFNGNAPITDEKSFVGFPSRMTAYVKRDSIGWGVDIPGKWNGINIKYVDDLPAQAAGPAKPAAPMNVGGALAKDTISVTVDAQDLSMFSGRVLSNLLPKGEKASVVGGKWKFAKAASVKWAKPKKGEPLPDFYDGRTGMGLVVDTTQGKTNLSGLTLTCETQTKYKDKRFKGSFKVYELQGEGTRTRLKEYTVEVNGYVNDGVGKGRASCKKPYISWPVTIE